ncbi:FAD-dependent oxidoreductase [Sedimenticola hydrogenitrophicus]|uniref:FAD-dependent oxidoreductase n=1 Tax=Sedimenticola hydrogenitrophicus TaxID=2967975 RepID=UPI0021A8C7E3
MSDTVQVDITLLGGGIAGLWSAATLTRQGYSVALIESRAIGGIQTVASQGIIHGGTKYALRGNLNESARAIAEMPGIWRACLVGDGPLDLRQVRVLAQHQHLWSTDNLISQLAGFFAGKAMRSRMRPIEGPSRPAPFDAPGFHGRLYQLDEPVLDIPSLIRELAGQIRERILLVPPGGLTLNPATPRTLTVDSGGERVTLESQRIILTAGKGNADLLQQLGRQHPAMQLRPLHMLILQGQLPPLYAHCLGAQANPRLTITSYPLPDGEQVWYIGGQLAENGVALSAERQIEMAQQELRTTMPWIDFSSVRWRSLMIERAEPRIASGLRPDSCYLHSDREIITAWPTKLAFAPRLASEITELLQSQGVKPAAPQPEILQRLPKPPLAQPPWQEQSG